MIVKRDGVDVDVTDEAKSEIIRVKGQIASMTMDLARDVRNNVVIPFCDKYDAKYNRLPAVWFLSGNDERIDTDTQWARDYAELVAILDSTVGRSSLWQLIESYTPAAE